jgi:lipase maturation factor 1
VGDSALISREKRDTLIFALEKAPIQSMPLFNKSIVHCPDKLTHSGAPTGKPLFIYDGDCRFCLLWVKRWKETTEHEVDFAPFQSVATDFVKDIPLECFQSAVRMIEPDGTISSGAEAVLRMLSRGSQTGSGAAYWCYRWVPGFAPAARTGYGLVAHCRGLASIMTTLLWGRSEKAVCRPTYVDAQRWFLRLMGVIYLIAFASFWRQVDGLIGHDGIAPFEPWLQEVRSRLGTEAYRLLPTLCWLNSSDWFLHVLCAGGVVFSLLLVLDIAPVVCLALLWASYLSLCVAGQVFMNFQWDYLLLEAGFLSLFLAPLRILPWRRSAPPGSPFAHFLLRWLLFRLMLMSGVVKLTSGDAAWWDLTALRYHYESQPLPTPLSWYAHQLPPWFQALSTIVLFGIELGAPFFLFAPRRLRLIGLAGLLGLQILIALTGNYCFFNLLTAALCLLSIDDATWPRFGHLKPSTQKIECCRWPSWFLLPVSIVVSVYSGPLLWNCFFPEGELPSLFTESYNYIEPFRSLNSYGLFRVMTKTRPEIIVEGSPDGLTWQSYEFRYKAGDLRRSPPFIAPHQPRLDWQMWFAALDDVRAEPWFVNFLVRLLEGSPPVLRLLERNPFPDAPPHYVRARLFRYRFTTMGEKTQTGAWWNREEVGEYCPAIRLPAKE